MSELTKKILWVVGGAAVLLFLASRRGGASFGGAPGDPGSGGAPAGPSDCLPKGTDLGFGFTCEGDCCVPPAKIVAVFKTASFEERKWFRDTCVWNGWAGPGIPSTIQETELQSATRLSWHTGGGRGGRANEGELCGRNWLLEQIETLGI